MSPLVVYRKELLDTLRDRRTLLMMLLAPMTLYPAALLLTSETLAEADRTAREQILDVGLSPPLPPDLDGFLRRESNLELTELSTRTFDARDARRALKSGLHAVIVMNATSAAALAHDGRADVNLYVDLTQPYGAAAQDRLEGAFRRYFERIRSARMTRRGLPETFVEPIALHVRAVETRSERGNNLLGLLFPGLVLMFVAISSFYPAVDLTAGEKERKTLATLLTSPTPLSQLVLGKLLAVVTIGALAGLLNVGAISGTLLSVGRSVPDMLETFSFDLSVPKVCALFAALLSAAFPLGAFMLFCASFARSFRDANLLLTPALFLCLLPAALTLSPHATLDGAYAMVPVANSALWMRAILTEGVTADRVLMVLVSSAGLSAALVAGVVRAFRDERALYSTEGRRADFKQLVLAPPRPGLGAALTLASIGFVTSFFVGSAPLDGASTITVLTQVLAYLLPTLVLTAWIRPSVPGRELLATRRPPLRGWIGGFGLGATAWLGMSLPMGWLTARLLPGNAEAAERFADALRVSEQPLALVLVVFAVLPGVVEEFTFRGAIYRLLGETRTAVWAQAALFGLSHGSTYRFLPTFALGLALGALRRGTGSVWPCIAAHVFTNGALILIHRSGPPWLTHQLENPEPWTAAATVAALGFIVIARKRSTNGFVPDVQGPQTR